MSVIMEFDVPSASFRLGRILGLDRGERVALEQVVPARDGALPAFWHEGGDPDRFERELRDTSAIDHLRPLDQFPERLLYAVDWADDAPLGDIFTESDAQVLRGAGTGAGWSFRLRFQDREAVTEFRSDARVRGMNIDLKRIYDTPDPGSGDGRGLTDRQRETLVAAVQQGYYDIPRRVGTSDLAAQFGVSAQAISERLRRGTETLLRNTLLASAEGRGSTTEIEAQD